MPADSGNIFVLGIGDTLPGDSFDPCIACAVHVVDPRGEELIRLKVR